MELLFLGTGAADWSPEFKAEKDYRRFSSALLDGNLLIDPGPHILDFEESFGYQNLFENVRYILLTHSHEDHLDASSVKQLCQKQERQLWCNEGAVHRIETTKGLTVQVLPLYTPTVIGDYTVTAVPANHKVSSSNEQCVHYIIERDGKRLFYGCDGGWLLYETWLYLQKLQFDCMVLEGTLGDVIGDERIFGHNNLRMVELMAETFRKYGTLKAGGQIWISHLSRYTHDLRQSAVENRLSAADIHVAYDNCRI